MPCTSSTDLARVGIEIRREDHTSWRDTVARYARHKNLTMACIAMFDSLIADGFPEPWAALRSLDLHGCTDVIIERQHLDIATIHQTLS
jgi:hypothetical protein